MELLYDLNVSSMQISIMLRSAVCVGSTAEEEGRCRELVC